MADKDKNPPSDTPIDNMDNPEVLEMRGLLSSKDSKRIISALESDLEHKSRMDKMMLIGMGTWIFGMGLWIALTIVQLVSQAKEL